jgi:hypothetical protein
LTRKEGASPEQGTGLSVKIDLLQFFRISPRGQGIDLHQIQKKWKSAILDEPPLTPGELLHLLDLPGEGEHVMADQPLHIRRRPILHSKTVQDFRRQLCSLPVMAEGPNPSIDLPGDESLSDIVEQGGPGQPPVRIFRQVAHRQQGMDERIPFRVVDGRLGNIFQAVDLWQDPPQAFAFEKSLHSLFAGREEQRLFHIFQIGHGASGERGRKQSFPP